MDYSHLAFILLALSTISLWFDRLKVCWGLCLLLSISLAGVTGILTPMGLIPIGLLIGSGLLYRNIAKKREGWFRFLLIYQGYLVALLLPLALALHVIPGFSPLVFFEDRQISSDALPYALRWNYDKAIAGVLLIRFFLHAECKQKITTSFFRTILITAMSMVIVFFVAYMLGLIRWDVKWPDFLLLWAFSNLFITCVAEEAFFRGFIQASLQKQLTLYPYGAIFSVVITSVLFGVAHVGGGWEYALVSGLAGIGYGAAYLTTGRLEASISTHFLLNVAHLTLFTYPMLSMLN